MQKSDIRWYFCPGLDCETITIPPTELPRTGALICVSTASEPFNHAGIVTSAELDRAAEMVPGDKAREFLACRAKLRQLLAGFIGPVAPKEIRIAFLEAGKPYLPDYPALKFNLSHSHGAVAFAFSRTEVGIDIEAVRPVPDWRDLAAGLLSQKDQDAIAFYPEEKQETEFLRCFTAREAYLKATGAGFSAPLPAMDFHSSYAEFVTPGGRDYLLAPLPPLPGFVGHVCLLSKSLA